MINGSGRWQITRTNHRVEFPPANRSIRSQESSLNIAAEYPSTEHHGKLLVECKKNNPEFVNWVFFSKQRESETDAYFVHEIAITPPPDLNH
jgi:hypothetical protein